MHVVKNDTVKILTGKYSGKTGKVLKVFPDQKRLIVEGVNIIKKHTKPSQKNPQGGIIEKESTIHVSNVMVIDPKTNEPTRVGYKFLEDGTKVRISKKSGEMLRS
ncbi:MAG: 50S ribosomal protein L24 [Calditrichia bacterium]|jgi:large subunit ribosomal protein L24